MRKIKGSTTRWGALWHSRNRLDGVVEHLLHENGLPKLWRTKEDAWIWIHVAYGYIATRKDLRAEPHNWRMPKAVKVKIRWEAKPCAK